MDEQVTKEKPKSSFWILLTEENILMYDIAYRTGIDKAVLLQHMDEAHRASRVLYVRLEDEYGPSEFTGTTDL